jgi:DNA (cytosine-5)-methyltransferase 1
MDLFAGAGGLSLGLSEAGIEPVVAVEADESAASTYLIHSPQTRMLCTDIVDIDFKMFIGEVDVVSGGPPCQPFSSGGLRASNSDLRDMVPWFVEAIEIIAPPVVLMENVPGLTVGNRRPYFEKVLAHLRKLGYYVSWEVLNAAAYGVPQLRHRLFVIAMKHKPFVFPKQTHGENTPRSYVNVNDVLPSYQIGEPNLSQVFYAKKPQLRPNPHHGLLFNGGGRPIDRTRPAPTILASAGGNKTHFFDELNVVPEYHEYLLRGGTPKTGALPGARRLTVLESSIIQTFPRDLIFQGTRSSQYQQVGNAVPPLLSQILGRAIQEQLWERGEVTYHILGLDRGALHQIPLFDEEGAFMSNIQRNEAIERAVEHALKRVDAFIAGAEVTPLMPQYRRAIEDLIGSRSASVVTCTLLLMFYRLEEPSWDLRSVPRGLRGRFGDKGLCENLTKRSITLHNNIIAFGENLGIKGGAGTFDFTRDKRFKNFWGVLEDVSSEDQQSIADYLAYKFAESRKVTEPLPPVPNDLLTFARAKKLFHELLALQTEGHVQQLLVTALLETFRIKQSITVRTHHPHAPDKFDNRAGDIEEFVKDKLYRAYEVTMRDDWQNRISGFVAKMQRFKLDKYIIIASNINNTEWSQPAHLAFSLEDYGQDIAVIDIRDVINFFTAELSATELRSVVNRTYDLLANPNYSGRHDFLELYRIAVGEWLDSSSRSP